MVLKRRLERVITNLKRRYFMAMFLRREDLYKEMQRDRQDALDLLRDIYAAKYGRLAAGAIGRQPNSPGKRTEDVRR